MQLTAQPGSNVPVGSPLNTSGQIGPRGALGPTGSTGDTGPPGFSATTKVLVPFTVPLTGLPVLVFVEDPSWIEPGQLVYIEGAGANSETGAFEVRSVEGNWISLLSPVPPTGSFPAKSFLYLSGDRILTPEENGLYFICLGGEMTITLPKPEVALSYSVRNDMTETPTGPVHIRSAHGSAVDRLGILDVWPEGEVRLFTDGNNWRTFSGGGRGGAPVGGLLPFGGRTVPIGYLLCDGQWCEIEKYPRLFSVVGHAYSTNDGTHSLSSWFQVPDLRSRVPVGTGPLDTQPSFELSQGQKFGTPHHALTIEELALHNHIVDINHTHAVGIYDHNHGLSDPGHQNFVDRGGGNHVYLDLVYSTSALDIYNAFWAPHAATGCWVDQAGNPGGWTNWVSEQAANWHVRGTSNSGSGLAHNNVPPSLGVNYIIRY